MWKVNSISQMAYGFKVTEPLAVFGISRLFLFKSILFSITFIGAIFYLDTDHGLACFSSFNILECLEYLIVLFTALVFNFSLFRTKYLITQTSIIRCEVLTTTTTNFSDVLGVEVYEDTGAYHLDVGSTIEKLGNEEYVEDFDEMIRLVEKKLVEHGLDLKVKKRIVPKSHWFFR